MPVGWPTKQARNLVWELEERGVSARILIRDNDAKLGGGADAVVRSAGLEVIRTPIAAPRANAVMERQIGSTRRECLDWLLILSHRHLERVMRRRASTRATSRRAARCKGHRLRTPPVGVSPTECLRGGETLCAHTQRVRLVSASSALRRSPHRGHCRNLHLLRG